MIYSAALPSTVHDEAIRHLVRVDGQEDLCFGLWRPSTGEERLSALVYKLLLPRKGERAVHGNASFTGNYVERAIKEAVKEGAGICFLHSHPYPGWQGMSSDDKNAERRLAPSCKGATGLPLVGLTVGSDGAWSARFSIKVAAKSYDFFHCESVRVVGSRYFATYHPDICPAPTFKEELKRTISAWGDAAQADLARIRFGVIGAGSVGNIVAESLARMGAKNIFVMDFDTVELHNLDRLLHASVADARDSRSKVDLIRHALYRSATADNPNITISDFSIVEQSGFKKALDCDILFSCVDRPWPRNVMNLIAYAHLVPVVDGGIIVTQKLNGTLRHADWRAHVVAPTLACLECIGQYDAASVALEMEGRLDDPQYIASLPAGHPLKQNQNVFAFSLNDASLLVLQMLSYVLLPSGVERCGNLMYHMHIGKLENIHNKCHENCSYPSFIAKGDHSAYSFTGRHLKAEQERAKRFKGEGDEVSLFKNILVVIRKWWNTLRGQA